MQGQQNGLLANDVMDWRARERGGERWKIGEMQKEMRDSRWFLGAMCLNSHTADVVREFS